MKDIWGAKEVGHRDLCSFGIRHWVERWSLRLDEREQSDHHSYLVRQWFADPHCAEEQIDLADVWFSVINVFSPPVVSHNPSEPETGQLCTSFPTDLLGVWSGRHRCELHQWSPPEPQQECQHSCRHRNRTLWHELFWSYLVMWKQQDTSHFYILWLKNKT